MLCERSYDPLSRMLLKGDEGGCKIRRGGGRKWRFSPGGSLPLDDLRVTSNRDGFFFIFLTSLFSSLHYLGRSNKLHVTLRCRVDYVQNGALKLIGRMLLERR